MNKAKKYIEYFTNHYWTKESNEQLKKAIDK